MLGTGVPGSVAGQGFGHLETAHAAGPEEHQLQPHLHPVCARGR